MKVTEKELILIWSRHKTQIRIPFEVQPESKVYVIPYDNGSYLFMKKDEHFGKSFYSSQKVDDIIHIGNGIEIKLTAVRCERLHKTNSRDWKKDFCPSYSQQEKSLASFTGWDYQQKLMKDHWDEKHPDHPYDSNPFVWVYDFVTHS
jgi:predicted GIY-YIG superfamily endonuclease